LASRSQNIKGLSDDAVKFQIYNIERKINRANEKRQDYLSHHLEKSAGYQSKVDQTLLVKSEIQEKHKYDILNKVVLKHHNKLKKL
jgi:hypothetical protein